MDSKAEGELTKKKHHTSGGGEAVFGVGLDHQIANIEDQLLRAQDTLEELQLLKTKLEEERKKNIEQAKKEKELLSSEELKKENNNLKTELKEYQGEINSLKKIIASLKDDLIKNTEQLKSKVADSLKIIEEADASLKNNKEIKNFEIPKEKVASLQQTEENAQEKELKELDDPTKAEDIIKRELEVEIDEAIETDDKSGVVKEEADSQPEVSPIETTEEKSAEVIPTETKTTEPTSEPIKTAEVTAELVEEKKEETKPAEATAQEPAKEEPQVNPTPVTPIEESKPAEPAQVQAEPAIATTPAEAVATAPAATTEAKKEEPKPEVNDSTLDELSEYDRIKKELEALESESIFHESEEKKTEASAPASTTQDPKDQSDKGSQGKIKKIFSLLKKKDKKAPEKTGKEPESEKKDQGPNSSSGGTGKVLIKASIFLLIIFSGGIAYRMTNADKLKDIYIGQAKGAYVDNSANKNANVPDQFKNQSPEEKYKEAFADAPFENTIWDTHSDVLLGLKIDYPKNTSYRLRPVGSDNLWFLRKNGYLVKIEQIETDLSPEEYQASLKSSVSYKAESVTFKDLPALKLTPTESLPVNGITYLIQRGDGLIKLWYKTYTPAENPDDEKRVTRMIDSLQFINN